MSEDNKVWIVDMDNRKPRKVEEAKWYQKDGYHQFMADPEKKQLNYTKGGYVFTIVSFDGNSSFCLYTNESGVQRILSNDKKALNEYVKNQNAAIKKAANQKATNQNAANQNAANQNAAIKNAANKEAAKQNAARQEASLSPAGDVWRTRMDGSEPVTKADPNQADAYHKFMSQSDPKRITDETYVYPGSTIVISTFQGRKSQLSGRFCQSVVENKIIILSDDRQSLETYNNRTSHHASWGGNRTKRSRKTKRSKRAHTSKRK